MSIVPSREEALFSDALAQPPAERGAFLAKTCGEDVELLSRLVALVATRDHPNMAKVHDAAAPETCPHHCVSHDPLTERYTLP